MWPFKTGSNFLKKNTIKYRFLCKNDNLQLRADAAVTFLQITGDIWRQTLLEPSSETSLEDCRIHRLTAAILSVVSRAASRTYSYNSAATSYT